MPKIKIEVRQIGGTSSWKEDYHCSGDPQKFAMNLIERFNATLRTNEKPRELVGVEVIEEEGGDYSHDWSKINAVTIIRGDRAYDKLQCKRCGITGKRFGLNSYVVHDSQFRAKKYDICHER